MADRSTQGQRYVDANIPENRPHPSAVSAQRAHDITASQGGVHAGSPWDERKHPRSPAGTSEGGKFTSGTAVSIHAPGHPNHGKTGTVVSVGNDSEHTHQIKLKGQRSSDVNAYAYHPARDLRPAAVTRQGGKLASVTLEGDALKIAGLHQDIAGAGRYPNITQLPTGTRGHGRVVLTGEHHDIRNMVTELHARSGAGAGRGRYHHTKEERATLANAVASARAQGFHPKG